MDLKDISTQNLDDLEQNPAWRFFQEEQRKLLSSLSDQLRQPSATTTLDEVRLLQGRVIGAEDNIAWLEITRQQIEEETIQHKQEEEPTDD